MTDGVAAIDHGGKHGPAAKAWMDRNPAFMELYRRFAMEALTKRRPFSISLLTERIRWECFINYESGKYKICNSYRAMIARELIRRYPVLKPYIRLRKLDTEKDDEGEEE